MACSANQPNHSKSRQRLIAWFRGWCIILLSFLAFSSISCAQAPNNKNDVNWLIDVLELKEGSVIADVGAGDGDQTLAIARHIGTKGKIYSTEVGSLRNLRRAVEQSDFSNITVIEGHPKRTNLPEQCCDAIYMRRVYHHIKYPDEFNNSLWNSLRTGGRLAIIDFEPRGSEANPSGRASGSQHGVTAATVVSELKKAGFKLISSEKGSGRNIYVVAEKPENLNK
jgi:ubiquinone/menaquinone biosynthesis C-methylase UbiE